MQTLSVDSKRATQRTSLPGTHPLRVVALGDSLIYGFGDPEGGGWVERLRRQWMLDGSAGHVVYNLGVRGDRVQSVAQRLEDEFRNRGELRSSRARYDYFIRRRQRFCPLAINPRQKFYRFFPISKTNG